MTGASYIWAPGTTLCDGIAAEYAQENRLVRFHHDFEADILSTRARWRSATAATAHMCAR